MPGDPIYNVLGGKVIQYDLKTLDEMRAKYGLDKPLFEQYLDYLSSISRLDLGYSIEKMISVMELLRDRIFWTLILILPSIVIGDLMALIIGTIAGCKNGKMIDRLLTYFSIIFYASPSFLLAMIFIFLFSFHLRWFPFGHFSSGMMEGLSYLMDVMWHMFLPVTILSIIGFTYIFFVVRNSVTQLLGEYFIFVTKAKGLQERTIVLRHIMRNVLPQFVSMLALDFGFLVSGALIIEILFSLNGMGALIYEAVLVRDYPVLQGAFLVITIFVLTANLLADMLYGIVDPRIANLEA